MSNIELSKFCCQVIQQDIEEQNQNIRKFGRLEIYERCEVTELHKSNFHKLKSTHIGIEHKVLNYCALMVSIKEFFSTNHVEQLDDRVLKFKSKSARKTKKQEKLNSLLAVILELKDRKNMTYRQICSYLKKYHKLEIVASTLHKFLKEHSEGKI
jgi:hypothetical protein